MAEIVTLMVGAVVAFISTIIIMTSRPSQAQKWFMLATISVFVYMTANYVKRHTGDPTIFVYMQEAIYVSTVLLASGFLLAVMEVCEIPLNRRIKRLFVGILIFCCVAMMTINFHDFWYQSVTLYPNSEVLGLYKNETKESWMFYLLNALQLLLLFSICVYLLLGIRFKKGRKNEVIRMLLFALTLPTIVFVLSVFKIMPNTMTNHSVIIAVNIAMVILMIRYDVAMTLTAVKEQAVESAGDGIVIMDRNHHFQFANEVARRIFPEMSEENPDIVTAFIDKELRTDTIRKDGRKYVIRTDEEKDMSGHRRGYLLMIHDITDQELRIREKERTKQVEQMLDQAIAALAQTIDAKDSYTIGHSSRVAKYSRMIAERMGLDDIMVKQIYRMGLLHDVGKIGVSDYILRKDSKLSDEEYDVIKMHPVKGDEILNNITSMPELHIGARWHHERYDGKGYPDKLAGDDIPIEARIIGVADSYDAMTSNRSYRKYLSQEVVRAEIEKNIGLQFDPDAAKCMLEIMDEDEEYTLHE